MAKLHLGNTIFTVVLVSDTAKIFFKPKHAREETNLKRTCVCVCLVIDDW